MRQKRRRKTFILNNDNNKIISAGGALIYKIENNNPFLLLININNKYEDLGGKVDNDDTNIYDTVTREIYEESNGLVYNNIKTRLMNSPHVYISHSKYLLFITQAILTESHLKKEDFGDKEIHDNIARTIDWIPINDFLDNDTISKKLNPRLKNKFLFKIISDLNNI